MERNTTMSEQLAFRTPSSLILTSSTAMGYVAVAVVDERIFGISIGHSAGRPAAGRLAKMLGESLESIPFDCPHDVGERLALEALDRVVRYSDGEPVTFDDLPVALDHLSPFQRRVAAACRAIPRGRTRTYGELATKAGAPGAARAVGQVMAGNRTPLIVPCHRVVAAGGGLGGFSAPQGLALKRQLLAMESGEDDGEPLFEPPARSKRRAVVSGR
jgi:methylated-DNA-[protein]-cysteine S-methyltransferase